LRYASTLKVEAAYSSEMSLYLYQTTRHNIHEDDTPHSQGRQNLKSHTITLIAYTNSFPKKPCTNSSCECASVVSLKPGKRRLTACVCVSGRHHLRMMVTEDMDCLSALHAVFHELQLVRVQRRPKGPPDNRHPRYELLLGDLHSRPELRNFYRPSAFQTPLLRADQVSIRL
jgi:hypothetical protein